MSLESGKRLYAFLVDVHAAERRHGMTNTEYLHALSRAMSDRLANCVEDEQRATAAKTVGKESNVQTR